MPLPSEMPRTMAVAHWLHLALTRRRRGRDLSSKVILEVKVKVKMKVKMEVETEVKM